MKTSLIFPSLLCLSNFFQWSGSARIRFMGDILDPDPYLHYNQYQTRITYFSHAWAKYKVVWPSMCSLPHYTGHPCQCIVSFVLQCGRWLQVLCTVLLVCSLHKNNASSLLFRKISKLITVHCFIPYKLTFNITLSYLWYRPHSFPN